MIRLLLAPLLVALLFTGCAARGSIQDTALAVGELVLAVDAAERDAYAAQLYDQAKHDQAGKAILRLLYAARAFERGVATNGDPVTLRADLIRTLEDVATVTAGIAPIQTAIQAVRAALGVTS